jgi:hypothetical protein
MKLDQLAASVMGLSGAKRAILLRLSGANGIVDDLLLVKYGPIPTSKNEMDCRSL